MSNIVVSDNGGSVFNVSVDDNEVADVNLVGEGSSPVQVIVQSVSGADSNVASLKDLLDVNASNLSGTTNKFVLTYDAPTDKFKFVNPDDVIDSAVGVTTSDPAPVGLTTQTIDYLDVALDNKIDLDAGEW
tara:strand:+ start:1300 stop:1692 length:393 start_codon:yes stop_codon:yes gene_type:complete